VTHFTMFDTPTFNYLLQLKALNCFWFEALSRCSKKSPKLAKRCLEEIDETLHGFEFDSTHVNIFQVCLAANKGILELESFAPGVSSRAWETYRGNTVKKWLAYCGEMKPHGNEQ
jgi:hypothetical protein